MQLLTGILCLTATFGQVQAMMPHRNLTVSVNDFPRINTNVLCRDYEFRLTKVLGNGAYGMVYRGLHEPTGSSYAIKLQRYDTRARKNLVAREVHFLKAVKNDRNIVQMRCYSRQTYGTTEFAIFVMDFMRGNDLFHYAFESGRRQMSEQQIRHLLRDLAGGLEQLYRKNIVHHDLKPENILLTRPGDDAVLKLADLGGAYELEHEAMLENKRGGTPQYMSPERLLGQPHGYSSELWAVGIILYALFMQDFPFIPPDNNAAPPSKWAKLLKETFSLDELKAQPHHVISLDMKILIQDLLQVNEIDRMSMETFFQRAKFCHGDSCFKRLNFNSI